MMRTSHSMTRRRNGVRKGDIFEKMDAHSSSSKEKGHLQKWVKKTEQPERNETLKGISSKSSIEAYAGDSGISCIHMQANIVYVAYIHKLLCSRPCICGKALRKRLCTWIATLCDGITLCCRV